MIVKPITEVALNHRAYPIAISVSGHVAALSGKGRGSFLPPDCSSIRNFSFRSEATDVSISADGSLLALVVRGRVVLFSTESLKPIHRLDDPIDTCHFDAGGNIWSVTN